MNFKKLFSPPERLISFDIGSGSIKMLEMNVTGSKPELVNIAIATLKEDIFTNNVITRTEIVSEAIKTLTQAHEIQDKRAMICVPGPSALMKKIRISKMKLADMRGQVELEAGSFVPGGTDQVRIDFHLLDSGKEKVYDALVVAVKNDVVDSFLAALFGADIETALIDIDYFALNNCYALNYPEYTEEVSAILDIGSRFSNVILTKNSEVLYAGDVSVGGKSITEVIQSAQDCGTLSAEEVKLNLDESDSNELKEVVKKEVDKLADEFNRQLNLFWNASGLDDEITKIILTGGGCLLEGFSESLQERTGLSCEVLDPFRNISLSPDLDLDYVQNLSPIFSVAVGLGLRQPGDRIVP